MGAPSPGSLLCDLPPEHLQALTQHAVTRTFPKNTIIISEGDDTDSLYVLQSGRAKVFVSDENGHEAVLDVAGPGECFGEMVLDGGHRSASVMTLETSKLLVISKGEFERFLTAHPLVALQLIRRLIQRIRALTENVKSLALMDVYGRVARLLLELAEEREGKLVISGKLTQQDLANRIGASREMVSRIFRDLTIGGYITISGKTITINKKPPPRW
jgi:CRP/FNR family transcriptional regulator, cyclic AMP receptor protein